MTPLTILVLNIFTASATSDASLTLQAKVGLHSVVGTRTVCADTVDGIVTLFGKVANEQVRADAEAAVKRVVSGSTVRDFLQIVPSSRAAAVTVSDDKLRAQIAAALKADVTLGAVQVKAVDNGVVLLSGSAPSLTEHLHAIEVADAVPGVSSVRSEIKSQNTLGDEEIWHDKHKNPAQSFPGANDIWITQQIKERLRGDASEADVNVDTHAGVVTLFGSVGSARAKQTAASAARSAAGVRSVDDWLIVEPAL